MKSLPLILSVALFFQPVPAKAQCMTLGDSLTFAYEAEFGFEVWVPFVDTFGDGFGPEVRNWIEILNNPAYRKSYFNIGITPDIKSKYPTDPLATGRVSEVLAQLNNGLAVLADERDLGYADVFTPTLKLLEPAPLVIHGIPFVNAGSTTGNLNYVWLNGEYSANFHPNTNAQAFIANEIIDAFNTRYDTGIARLAALVRWQRFPASGKHAHVA